jgi:DNA-binding NtrC family response regulator
MIPHLNRLAGTNSTLLITGRTGTGKSHLAREIHDLSPRSNGRFVAINLATLSENLIESELFGHEKGAFSGAEARRTGKLEWANGGTAFLDEIGELPLRLQTKLLEALNSRTISPVGSNREISLNVRIITATNRNLESMVEKGTFREDLYFRINTFQIHLPDLSAEPWKIGKFAERFAMDSARIQNRPYRGMDGAFRNELQAHPWPGNVRELKNAVEFAVAMSPDGWLGTDCLPPSIKSRRAVTPRTCLPDGPLPTDYREAKSLFERSYLQEVLTRFQGRINATAKSSGMSKVTLIEKIRRYDIDVPTIKFRAHQASGKEAR